MAEDPAPVEEEGAPAVPTQEEPRQEEPTQEPAPAQGQLAGCAFRMESQPYGSDPACLVFGEDGRFEAYNFDLWEMKEHRGTLQSSYQLLPDGSIRVGAEVHFVPCDVKSSIKTRVNICKVLPVEKRQGQRPLS